MAVILQVRRDTTANIAAANPPYPAAGELWMDTNKNALYIGAGSGLPIPVTGGVPISPNGASAFYTWMETAVTLSSGGSVMFTLPFPGGYYSGTLVGLCVRVNTAITASGGATSFAVGTAAGGNQFANGLVFTLGTSAGNGCSPLDYYGQNLYMSSMLSGTPTGAFTAGVVRASGLILLMSPPTS
jgi:hypothetical protein